MSYFTKLVYDQTRKSPDFDGYAKAGIAIHDAAAAVNKVCNTDLRRLHELILDQVGKGDDGGVACFQATQFLTRFRDFAATVDQEAQALLAIGERQTLPAHTDPEHPARL